MNDASTAAWLEHLRPLAKHYHDAERKQVAARLGISVDEVVAKLGRQADSPLGYVLEGMADYIDQLTEERDAAAADYARELHAHADTKARHEDFPHVASDGTISPPPDFDALEKAFHDALPRGAQHVVGDLGQYLRHALRAVVLKFIEEP